MKTSDPIRGWWDDAHQQNDLYWLSGTPGEEVWQRLAVRNYLTAGFDVLNIGVGLGQCTRGLVGLGCVVSVLDISDIAISRVHDVTADGWLDPNCLPTGRFDLALSHLVAQHMADLALEEQIEHVLRSLKSGGILAVQFADHPVVPRRQGHKQITGGSVYRTWPEFEALVSDAGGEICLKRDSPDIYACGTVHHIAHIRKR